MRNYYILLVLVVSCMVFITCQDAALASNTQPNIVSICDDAKNNSNGNVPSFCNDYENSTSTENPVSETIVRASSAIAFFTSIVAVIMIMYAGFELITSSGDSQKITRARQIISYAVIGLVVIIIARLLVSFAIAVLVK